MQQEETQPGKRCSSAANRRIGSRFPGGASNSCREIKLLAPYGPRFLHSTPVSGLGTLEKVHSIANRGR